MIDGKKQLVNDSQTSMTYNPGTSHPEENEATPPVDTDLHDTAQAEEIIMTDEDLVPHDAVAEVTEPVPLDASVKADSINEETAAYQAKAETLTRDLDVLKAQLDERTAQYMRIAADFDNFRKRTQKEKEDLEQQVKISTVVELLPIVDNFERARSQIKPQTESEMTIHKSYQGVYKDLVDRLKRIGVAPMRAEGKDFDPNLHEAVMRETTDEYAEGVVVEELVRGYLLGDKVLRHAMVKVAAAPEVMVLSEEAHGIDPEV